MRLTYKYRLFPTSAQRTSLERVLELCRWVYNDTLAIRKDAYENTGKGLSLYDTNKMLTLWKTDKPALRQVYAQVLQNVQERVDLAFQAFFRRVKARTASLAPASGAATNGAVAAGKKDAGYPRFRGKGWYDSFTFKQSGYKLNGDHLFVSKVGDIPIRLHRPLCANVKTLTIQRDAVDNWYACFSCEFAHQTSRKLVNEYQFIAFEKLDIAEMQVTGNKVIRRNIADVAWGQFVQFSAHKAANAGRRVALVNPRGTTQICSGCGEIVPKDLSMRVHDCPHCGLKLNRDHNAALNILARGLAGINAGSPDEVVEAQVF
jgi:IS605 OrfB family transposase